MAGPTVGTFARAALVLVEPRLALGSILGHRALREVLALVRSLCPVVPLTIETTDRGRLIAERYGMAVYDAMIVASALLAGCETLYSEDMQNGLVIDRQLRIRNPFAAIPR